MNDKFEFDIANLKNDLAIENVILTEEDIELLKRYSKKEFSLNELIDRIKNSILEEVNYERKFL